VSSVLMVVTIHIVHEGRALCPIYGAPSSWPPFNTWVSIGPEVEASVRACGDPSHGVQRYEMCAGCMQIYENGRPEVPDDRVQVQFVVLHNHSEGPGVYVVRRCLITPGDIASRVSETMAPRGTFRIATDPPNMQTDRACVVAPTLELARGTIPDGLTCFPRSPEDDPAIVEVWL